MIDISNYKELLVIDIECTCCEDGSIPREEMEIIEIGIVSYEINKKWFPFDSYESLVLPKLHPELTDFCSRLTNIKQEELDNYGSSFETVITEITDWLKSGDGNYIWGSWGMFDFYKISKNCEINNSPNPLGEIPHINLKSEFSEAIKIKKGLGLKRALSRVGLKFEGEQHRALSDAENTGRLLPFIYGEK